MDPKAHNKETGGNETDLDIGEELVGVLTAISVVSKRLARKLTALQQQAENAKGGKANEQDE